MLGTNPTQQKLSNSGSSQSPQELNLGHKPQINTTRDSLVSASQASGTSPAHRETIKFHSDRSSQFQDFESEKTLTEQTMMELKKKDLEGMEAQIPNWRFSDRVRLI